MIETNEAMLKRGRARRPKNAGDSTIIDPVYIEDNVTLKKSKIGPNVSIGAGSVLDGAEDQSLDRRIERENHEVGSEELARRRRRGSRGREGRGDRGRPLGGAGIVTPVAAEQKPRPKLGRNVIGLGAVSFFTDVSTEMIYPLLPVFLAGVLGANASFIGAIEGTAETTASLLKLLSGWWSDKVSTRKPFVVAGYLLASIVRPFTAAAHSATQVLAIRVTDRVGKGIRTSARDALLADSAAPEARGRAFGFHAAADNAGAYSVRSWRSLSSGFTASARSIPAGTSCHAMSTR